MVGSPATRNRRGPGVRERIGDPSPLERRGVDKSSSNGKVAALLNSDLRVHADRDELSQAQDLVEFEEPGGGTPLAQETPRSGIRISESSASDARQGAEEHFSHVFNWTARQHWVPGPE